MTSKQLYDHDIDAMPDGPSIWAFIERRMEEAREKWEEDEEWARQKERYYDQKESKD